MRMPTPLRKLSTPRRTRHSTGSVLGASPNAAQTPATSRPFAGRTSCSRANEGPSAAPTQGGGGASSPPGGGGAAPGGGEGPPGGGGGGTGPGGGGGGSRR